MGLLTLDKDLHKFLISLPGPIKKRPKVSEIILTNIGSGHWVVCLMSEEQQTLFLSAYTWLNLMGIYMDPSIFEIP